VILIRDFHNLRGSHRPSVVSIGNYDGVHLGHLRLISALQDRARQLGVPATVMTFEPHPSEFFSPERAPPRLLRWREKMERLACAGVDQVFCLRFNQSFAENLAQDFVQRYLVDGLGIRHAVVGDDFRFGRNRAGNTAFLRDMGAKFGFTVTTVPTCEIAGERVSSSRIRSAIQRNDFALAERLLGYPYTISGRVVHGDERGRTIGFPTANIILRHDNLPVWGVYAVTVSRAAGQCLPAVANIGVRPTIGGDRVLLEAHLLNFDSDLYGVRIKVEFKHKIRSEKRFDSVAQLQAQIARDTEVAREWLAQMQPIAREQVGG